MTKRRTEIVEELIKIKEHDPSGDPHQLQMKAIAIKNAEVNIEVIATLEKLDASNKKLTIENIKLQKRVFWLTIVAVSIAAIALIVQLILSGSSDTR